MDVRFRRLLDTPVCGWRPLYAMARVLFAPSLSFATRSRAPDGYRRSIFPFPRRCVCSRYRFTSYFASALFRLTFSPNKRTCSVRFRTALTNGSRPLYVNHPICLPDFSHDLFKNNVWRVRCGRLICFHHYVFVIFGTNGFFLKTTATISIY